MPTHRDYTSWAFTDFWLEHGNKILENKHPIVLDVGCRDKSMQNFLEMLGLKWIGVDCNPADPEVANMNMTELRLGGETIDLVFICHAFEHCHNPLKALQEAYRVLKKGGYLFISSPNPIEKQITNGDEDHIFVLNPMQMEKLLNFVGLKNVKSYLQIKDIKEEQNYNVISIGGKE